MKRFVTSWILLMFKEAKKLLLRASNASALLCCLELLILTFSLALTPLVMQAGKHLNNDAYVGQILSTKCVSSESLDLNHGRPYSLKFHPIEFYGDYSRDFPFRATLAGDPFSIDFYEDLEQAKAIYTMNHAMGMKNMRADLNINLVNLLYTYAAFT